MIMPVDVVLPCAPATDTSRWPAMSQASACERCSTGSPRSRASWYSGLSCQSAPVTTSASASPTLAASCPIAISAPRSRRAAMFAESRTSDPVTRCPAPRNSRAMPLMPEPPMPTKCTAPSSAGIWAVRSGLMVTCGGSSSVRRWAVGSSSSADAAASAHPTLRALRGVAGTPAERGVDEGDHAVGAVAMADGCRRGGHARDACRVAEQRDELVAAPSRAVKSASSTRMPPPAPTTSARVEPLLAVADRVRHVHGRDAERGQLADRCRARARHGERRRSRGRGPCGRRTRPCGSREAGVDRRRTPHR